MTSDMTDEIYADPARPLIMHVAIQPQRPEMPLKLSLQQGCRLSAASVASALGAHEDEVFVGAWAGLEEWFQGVWRREVWVVQRH